MFQGRPSITARDLSPKTICTKGDYDGEREIATYEELAQHGFMLLGERCRSVDEKLVMRQIINDNCQFEIEECVLYNGYANTN